MRRATPVQTAALLVGAAFLLVGILGFIPGITTHYSDLTWAGSDSDAQLLGLFQVSVLHNVVHIIFGIAGIAVSRSWETSRGFLLAGGAIYLVLWIYGLVIDQGSSANFVPLDTADNWLHFALGLGMLGLGAALGREAPVDRRLAAGSSG